MAALFVVELQEVEFIKGPDPDAPGGGSVCYVRRRPGERRQVPEVIGPIYGKLVLVGTVQTRPGQVHVDPSYVVLQSHDRYYIDVHLFVLEDAVASVRSGEPSRSEPLPLGTDSSKVPKDW